MTLRIAALAGIAIAIIVVACGGGGLESEVSQELSTAGGSVTLGAGASLHIPPGAILEAASITISRGSNENPPPEGLEAADSVGEPFRIEIEGQDDLASPVTVEVPYDPDNLPDGASESTIFLAYFDDELGDWIPVVGEVDTERNVIAVQTSHLSWWQVWTWNWGAWIAVLNNLLTLNLTDWFDAVALLTEECSQSTQTVSVDASNANNVIQGCVEEPGSVNPEVRVVNVKSFFVEVPRPTGGNMEPPKEVIGPGESVRFDLLTSATPPLVVTAEINQRSGVYLITHLIIQMLPGLNQLGIQGSQIACITERIADLAPLAAAVESLIVEHDGTAAAEDIANFLLDDAAVLRFITSSDDCFYGAAATWSPEGIRQIGAATATIMSATDFVANYLLNYHSEVAFNWAVPTATPVPTPTPIPLVGGVPLSNPSGAREVAKHVLQAIFAGDVEAALSVYHPFDQERARDAVMSIQRKIVDRNIVLLEVIGTSDEGTLFGETWFEVLYTTNQGSCRSGLAFRDIDGRLFPKSPNTSYYLLC